MYKKPLEEIAQTIQYEPLPREVRAVIIAAWAARGGMLSKSYVEQMVPAHTLSADPS